MDATIDRMIGTGAYGKQTEYTSEKATFIPSSTFQGAKPGYYFGTTDGLGTGYHLDHYAPQKAGMMDSSSEPSSQRNELDNGIADDSGGLQQPPMRKKRKKTGAELLAEAEAAQKRGQLEQTRVLQLDISGMKSATQTLEKSIHKNQISRAENPNQPEKFMDSELMLNDEITAWKDVAASTNLELYPHMVKLGTLKLILGLITHENNDVALSVLSLLVELIDLDLINADLEDPSNNEKAKINMSILVNEFLNEGGLDLIVGNMGRLDEDQDDEATGIDDTLTLLEAMLDLDSMNVLAIEGQDTTKSMIQSLLSETLFLSWLLDRINQKGPFHPIKLHSSELLASVLQNEDAAPYINNLKSLSTFSSNFNDDDDGEQNQKKKNPNPPFDGIEILLQAVAQYRKKDPTTEEECEFLENCFHALSAAMLYVANVETFLEAQGPELMMRCIREKVHAGGCSLRVLYYVLSGSAPGSSQSHSNANVISDDDPNDNGSNDGTNNVYKKACEYFVQVGGLSIIFPLFMGRKSSIPKAAKCSDAGNSDLAKKALEAAASDSKGNISKRAKRALQAKKEWIRQLESNAIHIVYCLTRYIDEESPYDAKDRLVVKFVEDDCAKCDRLVELCLKYDQRMRLAEARYYRSEAAEEAEREGLDIDLAALHEKLKGGGDLFHCIGAICAFASVESRRCHEHILEQLKVKNSGISCKYFCRVHDPFVLGNHAYICQLYFSQLILMLPSQCVL